jgi:hypothetical protein
MTSLIGRQRTLKSARGTGARGPPRYPSDSPRRTAAAPATPAYERSGSAARSFTLVPNTFVTSGKVAITTQATITFVIATPVTP